MVFPISITIPVHWFYFLFRSTAHFVHIPHTKSSERNKLLKSWFFIHSNFPLHSKPAYLPWNTSIACIVILPHLFPVYFHLYYWYILNISHYWQIKKVACVYAYLFMHFTFDCSPFPSTDTDLSFADLVFVHLHPYHTMNFIVKDLSSPLSQMFTFAKLCCEFVNQNDSVHFFMLVFNVQCCWEWLL